MTRLQRFERAIEQTDPEADAAVQRAFGDNSVDELNQQLAQFVASRDIRDLMDLPDEIKTLVHDIQTHIDSFDQNRIRRGQDLFTTHVGICAAALTVASLPEAYAMESSGRILGRTQRLAGASAFKRIAETTQFVLHVMTEKGLERFRDDENTASGTGAILRVRLMHAAIRLLVSRKQSGAPRTGYTDYSNNDWMGKPINQVEMLYTLLCFSWVPLRAMRQTYHDVSDDEANDYIYLWNCVGVLMGIESDLLPESSEEAESAFEKIKQLHMGWSAEGEKLTQSALHVMQRMLKKKAFVPNKLAPSITLVMMQQFVDQATRELLKIRKLSWIERLFLKPFLIFGFKTTAWIYRLIDGPIADDLKAEFGFLLLEYFSHHPSEVGVAEFTIPTRLYSQDVLARKMNDKKLNRRSVKNTA